MKDWIIAIGNAEADGVVIYQFQGNDTEVKEKLCELVDIDRANDDEGWCDGCEGVADVQGTPDDHEYNAYATYYGYHIDYTARELAYINYI